MPGFESVDVDEVSAMLDGAAGSIRTRMLPLAGSSELRTQLFALAAILQNAASHLVLPGARREEVGGPERDAVERAHARVRHELARVRRIDWDELSRGAP